MKSILKASLLATLFILTSCAHHHGSCSSCCGSQCEMHKDGSKDQCKKDQCKMKKDEKAETPSTEKK